MTMSEQLERMGHGDHVCLIYENKQEQMSAVIPYVKQGLERGEACVYIVDELSVDEVKQAFRDAGVDAEREERSGSLIFMTKRESYLKSGTFDPESMIAQLDKATLGSVSAGYSGLRITGEMTWALGDCCGCDRLIQYEALLNGYFPGSKATAICQYNRNRFSPEIIRDVLRTHPVAIVGDQVCPNLYYESPDMVLGREDAGKRVTWMIKQLKKHHAAELMLKGRIQARDEFLSIASHEIKTPLTSLNFQFQLLERKARQGSSDSIGSPEVLKKIEMANRQIKRLTHLVDDLLDVSRIRSDRFELDLEQSDLVPVARELAGRFADQALAAGSVLAFESAPRVAGEWDRSRIEQVLNNLLSNAIKFGDGKPISVSLESAGENAVIRVKDQGVGIPLEDQRRIFSRFERAVSTHDYGGLGLGLYITQMIIEAHGGRIDVESEPKRGSTFTVTLPLRASGGRLAEGQGAA